MKKIKLEINTTKETKDVLEESLSNSKFLDKLNEVLKEKGTSLNISTKDDNTIRIEEEKITHGSNEIVNQNNSNQNNVVLEKKENKIVKFAKSAYRVFEELIDSITKRFLKKKFKINFSVYNDSKKAITAVANNDSKTFFKKAIDVGLSFVKKIPNDIKKIIKSTKNTAIDEIYTWKETNYPCNK